MPTPTPTTTTASTFDPNSVEDFAVQNKLVPKWTPQNAAALFEKQGLGTAKQYLGAGTNNGAYNAALLAKLKGYSGANSKGIGGSPSIDKTKQISTAIKTAGTSLTPPPPKSPNQPAPATNSAGKVDSTVASAAYVDPVIANYTTQYNTAVDTEKANYEQSLNDANATFAPVYSQTLQDQKAAINSASAAFDAANPGISDSSVKEQFVNEMKSRFDNNLAEMSATHTAQLNTLAATHASNLQNLQGSFNSSVLAYQQQSFTDLNTMMKTTPIGPGVDTTPYLQKAMAAGMSLPDAIQYLSNPSYETQTLDINKTKAQIAQQNADTNSKRAKIAGDAYNLAYSVANSQTTTTQSAFDKQINDFFGTNLSATSSKTLGTAPTDTISNTSTSNGVDLSQFNSQ